MPPHLPELADYDVVSRLAVGGMAEVYRARARTGPMTGHEVVLKRLHPLFRSERAYVEAFLAEARLSVMLVHPNIVRTFDLFRSGSDYYLVQQLVPGRTLAELRLAAAVRGRRVKPAAALVAVADLLQALSHLHEGGGCLPPLPIVHRDVNPDNLMVGDDGVARLIDFGIAEQQGVAGRASEGALRGTPAYMSPEQVKGRALDARSDLFSAGIITWELLSGVTLFARENEFETLRQVAESQAPALSAHDASLPAAFDRFCARALSRDPDDRFQTAAEMGRALEGACVEAGVELDRLALATEVVALG